MANKFQISLLKEAYDKGDSEKILLTLLALKRHLGRIYNVIDVDKVSYEILINLIKNPNSKIMDISMSILANCCLKKSHREMFKDLGGIPHLILVVKTIDNDSISCRACRLIGNLAADYDLALDLSEHNVGFILLKSLENLNNKSPATIMMTFRAVKKLWAIKQCRSKMLPDDVCAYLNNCLYSTDDQIVMLSIETITLFSTVDNFQSKNAFKVRKELIAKLVDLFQKKELVHSTITCLSSLINNHTGQMWQHLEESKIADIFICYIQQIDTISKGILQAFYKLCTEVTVRCKVKISGLLPKLLALSNGSNSSRIIAIFGLFRFDTYSIKILAQEKGFVSLLTKNVTRCGVVDLLCAVSRLDPPVKELLEEENLNIIMKHKECHGILRKISQTKRFLTRLIVSGRIWELAKLNCLSEDEGEYTEALLVHLLRTGERSEIENTALAVPFLIKPRHYTLYKILAHNDAITIILRLLKERTLEEKILASIVKLISIFQENFHNDYKQSRWFFDDSLIRTDKMSICRSENSEDSRMDEAAHCDVAEKCEAPDENLPNVYNSEFVTFYLDSDSHVTVNRDLLCKNSPVLDAMLNGHFMESHQQIVKLSCCSEEAILNLEKLLRKEVNIKDISIETHLELISITDRFLMSNLNDLLTVSLPVDESSCVAVLQWCRNSGCTKSNRIIKKKTYEFVFSSSAHLLIAMRNDSLRTGLVNEISNYLSNSFLDLL